MKNASQVVLSVVILVGAVGVAAFQLRDGEAVPAEAGGEGHDHAAMMAAVEEQSPVRLGPEDARRIGVTFAEVELRGLDLEIEALGTVTWDESGLTSVNPKIDGWVEELFVDFTGAPVRRDQPLMSVYSPGLVSAQEELVLAARLLREAGEGRSAENARNLVESARRRLDYWDVPEEEVRRIEETGEIRKTITLRAPASGVVVEKNVVQGDRIMPGMTLFRISDLSRVWVEADVFEKDLGLVEAGRTAAVRFEAYPGRVFPARVTYVYPTVSMESRTGRVRLELPNPEGALKPGMYARITIEVPPIQPSLVVPRSAVLSTGTRALVFVQAEDGALVPRNVTPGHTAGRDMEILAGLEVGERVVSSAAFLVDAESSLGALTAGMEEMEMDVPAGEGHEGHGAPPGGGSDTPEHEGHDPPATDAGGTGHDGHRP